MATHSTILLEGASQVVLEVKNLPANAGDIRDIGSIPGSGRSPGEGNGNPLQYFWLENSKDRGALWGYIPWNHEVLNMTEQLTLSRPLLPYCGCAEMLVYQIGLSQVQ